MTSVIAMRAITTPHVGHARAPLSFPGMNEARAVVALTAESSASS